MTPHEGSFYSDYRKHCRSTFKYLSICSELAVFYLDIPAFLLSPKSSRDTLYSMPHHSNAARKVSRGNKHLRRGFCQEGIHVDGLLSEMTFLTDVLWRNQPYLPVQENGKKSRRGSLMSASESPASTTLSTAASDSLGHSQGLGTSTSQGTSGQPTSAAGDTGSSQVRPLPLFTDICCPRHGTWVM